MSAGTLYWVATDYLWSTLSNWNTASDGSGSNPSEVPWSGQDGSTNDFDLVDTTGGAFLAAIQPTLTLNGGIGSCNVNVGIYGTINGGTFSGSTSGYIFLNGTINGGTFLESLDFHGGTINGGNITIDGFNVASPSNINYQNITTLSGGNPFTGLFMNNLYNNGVWSNPATATLYYNNVQEDGDWGNLLNWWYDSGFTIQAISLPTSTNPINLYGAVTQNTQGANQCFCASANFWSADFAYGLTLQSTGVVNMQGSSVMAGHTTDGVSMHDSSTLAETSVIDADVTMRDSSRAFGYIGGNAYVYYDTGNGQFPIGGTVVGSVSYLGWPAVTPQWFNDQVSGGADDGDFSNKANWWTDNNYTTRPVNAEGTQELPDASTDVFIAPNVGITANTGTSNPTINSVTAYNSNIQNISITATNGFLFSGNEGVENAVLYGNVTFQDTAYNYNAIINGTATYKSAASLQNSWGENSLANLNFQLMEYGSTGFVVSIPTGNSRKGFLSSLLGFPWYIRF